jgi:aspartate racemase
VIGVLGGMGPLATADFLRKLTLRTPVTGEADHLTVAVWSDPTIPDRTDALLGRGPSPLPALHRGVERLTDLGADVIAMPCNTAHAFLPALRRVTTARFLDMVRLATVAAARRTADGGRIGLLATNGTRLARLYDDAATGLGRQLVHVPEARQQEDVDVAIAAIKASDLLAGSRGVRRAAKTLADLGAEVVIAGCTEIPLVIDAAADLVPFVDATDCLAVRAVQIGLGED